MRVKNSKNTQYCSDDLKINRNMIVKVKTINSEEPKVLEIGFSLYAVPKQNRTDEEYEESIINIKKQFGKICKKYVSTNADLFKNKSIIDCSFSSANLKKGYNKYATMSLYVSQTNNYKIQKIQSKVKNTIKECSFEITSMIQEEGFSCYKEKHK